jgi:hypothetical protein
VAESAASAAVVTISRRAGKRASIVRAVIVEETHVVGWEGICSARGGQERKDIQRNVLDLVGDSAPCSCNK